MELLVLGREADTAEATHGKRKVNADRARDCRMLRVPGKADVRLRRSQPGRPPSMVGGQSRVEGVASFPLGFSCKLSVRPQASHSSPGPRCSGP